MAGDSFRKKLAGQSWRPDARAMSALMDAAADAKARRSAAFGSEAVDQFRQSGIIKVLNASGAAVPRYGVLGLTSPVVTPAANLAEFQRQVVMNGATPVAGQVEPSGVTVGVPIGFAVMLDGVPAGGVGRGVVGGVVPCRVNVIAGGVPLSGNFADVLTGDVTQLQRNASGAARILWLDTSVGGFFTWTTWAVVQLG